MGIELRVNNSCFIFLSNKDILSFHFDGLKQKLNHLKVKEVVDTIQGGPGPLAHHIKEFNDFPQME